MGATSLPKHWLGDRDVAGNLVLKMAGSKWDGRNVLASALAGSKRRCWELKLAGSKWDGRNVLASAPAWRKRRCWELKVAGSKRNRRNVFASAPAGRMRRCWEPVMMKWKMPDLTFPSIMIIVFLYFTPQSKQQTCSPISTANCPISAPPSLPP